ncbi:unnamed protein product, partial [Lymnaea stagnalis]
GGDLFDAIATSTTKYTEEDASGMLYNLASALEYLHSLHIVHRDVKPENILVPDRASWRGRLTVGSCKLAWQTHCWIVQAGVADSLYGVKIDVWSAGVITYILLCGFPPFSSPSDNQDELFDMIMTGNYDFVSPYWDDVTTSAK